MKEAGWIGGGWGWRGRGEGGRLSLAARRQKASQRSSSSLSLSLKRKKGIERVYSYECLAGELGRRMPRSRCKKQSVLSVAPLLAACLAGGTVPLCFTGSFVQQESIEAVESNLQDSTSSRGNFSLAPTPTEMPPAARPPRAGAAAITVDAGCMPVPGQGKQGLLGRQATENTTTQGQAQ